jgi:hypothetical protein
LLKVTYKEKAKGLACGFGSHPPNAGKSWKVKQAICDEEDFKPWNGFY